jgi:hypothetical protein
VELVPGLSGEAVVTVNRHIGVGRYLWRRLERSLPGSMTIQ